MVRPCAMLLAMLALWPATAARGEQPATEPEVLTLERVLALVQESNPQVVAARLRAEAAAADVLSARVPVPENPTLEFEMADRSGHEGDSTDRGYSLSQSFFTGPVVRRRVEAAEAARAAAALLARDEERLTVAATARLFYEALLARERLGLAREIESVTGRLVESVTLRFEAGAATALDVNTARLQGVQAARARLVSEEALARLQALLAVAFGWEPATPLRLEGRLDPPVPPEGLLPAAGIENRPDLAAARQRILEMEASVGQQRAERWPELEASLFYEEEEGSEITGGGLAVTLPLFDRKKGEIARARAEAREAETRLHAATLQARAEQERASAALRRAEEVLALYRAEVLDAARENVSLMEASYREGKVRLGEYLVLRQTLVEAEEQYLEARFERAVATVDWMAATGIPLVGEGAGR